MPEAPGQEAGSDSGPHESGGHPAAAETGTASGRDDRHTIAQPEHAASPAAGPGDSRRMDANRAAVAANQAYRAGDLDQARQLIDQAAALDPSRAGLWQQHREQIAARRLILDARAAHAAGDHQRADQSPRRRPPDRPPHASHLGRRPGCLRACPASLPRPRARSPRRQARASPPRRTGWRPEPTRPRHSRESLRRPTRTHRDHRGHRHQLAAIRSNRSQLRRRTVDRHRHRPQARRQPDRDSVQEPRRMTQTPASRQPPATRHAGRRPIPMPPARTYGRKSQARPEPGTGQPSSGKQRQPGTAAGTEPVRAATLSGRQHPTPDWRDQILHQARQPGHPGPSWPHSPALRHTPEPGGPDAGLEPGR